RSDTDLYDISPGCGQIISTRVSRNVAGNDHDIIMIAFAQHANRLVDLFRMTVSNIDTYDTSTSIDQSFGALYAVLANADRDAYMIWIVHCLEFFKIFFNRAKPVQQ